MATVSKVKETERALSSIITEEEVERLARAPGFIKIRQMKQSC